MKKVHLLAAFLIFGLAAMFTSCIETVEPAGIEELRNAKAELLRAKAQVELAQAQYKLAETAFKQAQADLKAELAKQEALKTAYWEAYYEVEKEKLMQEMKKNEEIFNAKMYELQQATEEAKVAYERAVESLKLVLATLEDDVAAAALYDLMYYESFTYEKSDVYTNSNGEPVTYWYTESVDGLLDLYDYVNDANAEYMELIREKAQYEFAYTPETFKAALVKQLAIEEGRQEALENELADLKLIAETPLEEFEAKFEEIRDKMTSLSDKYNQLLLGLTEDAEYLAAQNKLDEINFARTAKSELKFDVPVELQITNSQFDDLIDDLLTVYGSGTIYEALYYVYYNHYLEYYEDGSFMGYGYPAGFSVSLTLSDQLDLLEEFSDEIDTRLAATSDVVTNEQIDYEGWQAQLTAAEAEWLAAYMNFKKAYDEGKYASLDGFDARSIIINKYGKVNLEATEAGNAAYAAETDPLKKADARTAAQNAVRMKFIAEYKAYLLERTKLDGLKLAEAADITTIQDLTVAADLAKWAVWTGNTLAENDRFGVADLSTVPDGQGYAGIYNEVLDDIGYKRTVTELVTYESWKELGASAAGLVPGGLADKTFDAMDEYKDVLETVKNHAVWEALKETITTLYKAVLDKINDLNEQEITNIVLLERKAEALQTEISRISLEIAGLQDILDIMENVIGNETGYYDYDDAMDSINTRIEEIEGIDYSTDPVIMGELPQAKVYVAFLTNMLAAVEAGTYEEPLSDMITYVEAEIAAKTAEIEMLEALLAKAEAKKEYLLEILAGGTETTTPPAE